MEVVDVPAKLASRVRLLSTGHGRKSDDADAVSVGVAALTGHGLTTARIDATVTALRAIVEHRDDLVKTRTQTVNRLHVVLTHLIPAGASRGLSAERAAEMLKRVRPRDVAGKTLRSLAADLVAEVRQLDRRIDKAARDIEAAVAESDSSSTQLCGIAALNAGKILARVGSVHRFRSASAFASYTGTAPIEASSGDVVCHRLSRAGDRQLNYVLHTMAITQIRRATPGRAYYRRKRAAGKSHREALRCLKRRLSDVVYRQLLRDATPAVAAGPSGTANTPAGRHGMSGPQGSRSRPCRASGDQQSRRTPVSCMPHTPILLKRAWKLMQVLPGAYTIGVQNWPGALP